MSTASSWPTSVISVIVVNVGDDLFFLEITPEYGVVLTSKYKYTTTRL